MNEIRDYEFHRFEPNLCPRKLIIKTTEFLFSHIHHSSSKQKEISLYLKYHSQSLLFIVLQKNEIIATVRGIIKNNINTKLPIESDTTYIGGKNGNQKH